MASPSVIISLPSVKTRIQSDPFSAKPNPTNGLLKSCRYLQEIRQIHCHYTKLGLMADSSSLTQLIAKYSQMGSSESLEYAEKAFNIFKNAIEDESSSTVYLYNSLIRANSAAGAFNEAILLYVDILMDGLEPDNYTFPFVLSACARKRSLSEGRQIHGYVVKKGYDKDVCVSNSLVYWYGECGESESARKVFDEMRDRNVVSWTSLICGYARREYHREAVDLFFEMVEEGIEGNEVTAVSVVSACAKLGDLDLGERVLDYVGKLGLGFNEVVVNAVVDLYIKCGDLEKARLLFDECEEKNLVLYNTIMSNFVKMGEVEDAVCIFRRMIEAGEKPDRISMLAMISSSAELSFGKECHAYVLRNGLLIADSLWNSLIDMYAKSFRQDLARKVFDEMPKPTLVSWNSLLAGFGRNGELESAKKVFDEMPERNVVSWNTMIAALVEESFFLDAIGLFQSMQKEGFAPDEATMVSVVSACGYLGALDLSKWTYTYIKKYGIRCNMQLSTALVDMFARCGDPHSATKIFSAMENRDVSAWTAGIAAASMEENGGHRAIELFHEMIEQGIEPDEIVFSVVLTACSHTGLVNEGMNIYNSMKEYGITPIIVHHGCIVDLLGRAGFLHEALDFIRTAPQKPNSAIWGSFLNACRKHRNDEMASRASKMITECGGDQTGIHTLLSNIYASTGRWNDVAKIRMRMRERGMRKKPGSSSIEVNGSVHEFTSGDESHPEIACIEKMLEEMRSRLVDVGYVPDLGNVLVDVDEEEKEFLLSRHSEKLAVAIGLVSSARGTPVRVVKNLRMCSDCHSFIEMVSKVYDREIVVRDNKRFHFFRRGSCSCRGFW